MSTTTPSIDSSLLSYYFNKVAFITGSATGIGRACALLLASYGCHVIIGDIDEKKGVETRELINSLYRERAVYVTIDVRSYESCEVAINKISSLYKRVDICIANAGIGREASILTSEYNEYKNLFDVNVIGIFNTIKLVSRKMVEYNNGGRIITIASANAVIASANASAYCASKAAIVMMTRCIAQDLIPFGITVNCIGPGATDTALMISQVPHKDAVNGLLNAIPCRRMATSEEIAHTVAFYCSEKAGYITGAFILQDGGLRDHNVGRNEEIDAILEKRKTEDGKKILEDIDKQAKEANLESIKQRELFGVK